ncbi:MAG: hypothetical protein R3E08_04480 [Thiotrichaceae bacterium]
MTIALTGPTLAAASKVSLHTGACAVPRVGAGGALGAMPVIRSVRWER